ncbi:MAG: enoyl-CoA hydratase-related protein [Hyphomonadaceae bacterium]
MSDAVLVSTSDSVATLTLNRPDALNALNRDLIEGLRAALADARRDEAVRAVLITGAGRGFCAGADLASPIAPPREGASRGDMIAASMETHFNPLTLDVAHFPKPTIAAVNGVAAGGGVGLALSCDMVLAAKSANFIQVFTPKLGLVPDMGCTWHLPRLVGRARARGLALLGDRLGAEEAERWGLIWKAVDDAALLSEANALAARLASGPGLGQKRTKELLDASLDNDFAAQIELERTTQGELGDTEDALEGVMAFLQKRPTAFKGR